MLLPGLINLAVLVMVMVWSPDRAFGSRNQSRAIPVATVLFALAMLIGAAGFGLPPSDNVSLPSRWRWAVSPWMHADPFHLLANIAAVVGLGFRVESRLGSPTTLMILSLGSWCGNVVADTVAHGTPAIGASGAIHALLATHATRSGTTILRWPIIAATLTQAACAMLLTESSTAFTAHVAGAMVGFLIPLAPGIDAPGRRAAMLDRVEQHVAARRTALAAGLLRSYLARNPGDYEVHWRLAEILIRLGERDGAEQAARAGLDAIPKGGPGVERLSELPSPKHVEWAAVLPPSELRSIGEKLASRGAHFRATEWLERAWRTAPETEIGTGAGVSAARILWMECNEAESARRLLREITERAGDTPSRRHGAELLCAMESDSTRNAQP